MSDQTGQPLVTLTSDEPAAVEWVKASRRDLRCVANVVQERRSDQRLAIVSEGLSDALGCSTNCAT